MIEKLSIYKQYLELPTYTYIVTSDLDRDLVREGEDLVSETLTLLF